MKKHKFKTTLVIGDAHDDPNFQQNRFDALGNFIVANQPDNIVQIGDWANLDSISFHYRNAPLLKEGRRLADDINSANIAYTRMMTPLSDYNNKRGKFKKSKYSPNLYWLTGNHEDRTSRYVKEIPELAGFLPEGTIVDLDTIDIPNEWKVVHYKDYCSIEGCMFTHAPINPATGRPFGGRYVTRRALENTNDTIVFGHSHVRQIESIKRLDGTKTGGKRTDSICVGAYFDYAPEYVRHVQSTLNWWYGLIILTHTGPGEVDVESINITRIKREYL